MLNQSMIMGNAKYHKGQQAVDFGDMGIPILLYLSLFLFPYTVYLMSLILYLSILHEYLFPGITYF